MMNEAIKLLAGGISAIIPPEYIGQKLIESGTGILWEKLKNGLKVIIMQWEQAYMML